MTWNRSDELVHRQRIAMALVNRFADPGEQKTAKSTILGTNQRVGSPSCQNRVSTLQDSASVPMDKQYIPESANTRSQMTSWDLNCCNQTWRALIPVQRDECNTEYRTRYMRHRDRFKPLTKQRILLRV